MYEYLENTGLSLKTNAKLSVIKLIYCIIYVIVLVIESVDRVRNAR